jgi:hypothetical protein
METTLNQLEAQSVVRIIRDLGDGLSQIWSSVEEPEILDNTLSHLVIELLALFPVEDQPSAAIYIFDAGKFRNSSAGGSLRKYHMDHRRVQRAQQCMRYKI